MKCVSASQVWGLYTLSIQPRAKIMGYRTDGCNSSPKMFPDVKSFQCSQANRFWKNLWFSAEVLYGLVLILYLLSDVENFNS
jgi:hypothetical protein